MKFLVAKFLTLAVLLVVAGQAEAGCGQNFIEDVLLGRTYSANNHPEYPTLLTFHPGQAAAYGSALAGHPGGDFKYRGLCSGNEVVVTFHPTLVQGPVRTVLHLECFGKRCELMKDKQSGQQFELQD